MASMLRGPCSPVRRVRREGARLLAVVVGFALVVGILRGGSHYFYCPFMDAVVTDHCCSESRGNADTFTAPDCCETETIGTLPSASGVTPWPELPALPLVAVLSPCESPGRENLSSAMRAVSEPTGPPMRAAQRAARLMVFLI
jgi:hypothetical protein